MIKFRKGFKYQLAEHYTRDTHIYGYTIETEFINLDTDGCLLSGQGMPGTVRVGLQ